MTSAISNAVELTATCCLNDFHLVIPTHATATVTAHEVIKPSSNNV